MSNNYASLRRSLDAEPGAAKRCAERLLKIRANLAPIRARKSDGSLLMACLLQQRLEDAVARERLVEVQVIDPAHQGQRGLAGGRQIADAVSADAELPSAGFVDTEIWLMKLEVAYAAKTAWA